jgi:hypothetical protein
MPEAESSSNNSPGAASGATRALLDPAAPLKSSKRNYIVIGAGIISSAVALLAVYLLQTSADENVMGWYADFVIPIGAILVGLVASSGYGLAAWKLGIKIRRGLLAAIIALQIGAYFTAQYTEFAMKGPLADETGHVLTFPEYFHLITVNTAWKDEQGKMGTPLGGLGYLLRLGELAGFVLGTLVTPLVLRARSYCELCEEYMQSKSLALLPASNVKAGHIFGKKAIQMTAEEALESGMTEVVELVSLGTAGDALALRRGQYKKLARRIDVKLVSCARCSSGWLEIQMCENHGRQVSVKKIGRSEVGQSFVRELRARKQA